MMIRNFFNKVYGTFCALLKGLAFAPLFALLLAGSAFASDATDVINAFHAKLLTTMQNAESWGFEKRREFLAGPIKETFDTATMVRLASTKANWNAFSDQEKADLEDAFYQFTLANYASRFKGYSGQEFVTVDETPMRGGRVLVRTKLIKSEGDEIYLNYVMNPDHDGDMKVVDIYLDGSFSELALRRSEFSPIIRDQGFTGLLSLLKQKVTNLEQEAYGAS